MVIQDVFNKDWFDRFHIGALFIRTMSEESAPVDDKTAIPCG
jgi:hypothetical protein